MVLKSTSKCNMALVELNFGTAWHMDSTGIYNMDEWMS